MCLAEGSLMVYPKIRPGILFLGHLVGAPGGVLFLDFSFGVIVCPQPAAPLLDKAPAVQPSIRSFFGQQ